MDQFDLAQKMDARFRDQAIRQARSVTPGESRTYCVDCKEEIPELRRIKMVGCVRCVECQEELEQRRL